jgi:alcohol dehydrogenase YqhD (iron-dependent ADH family)
VTAHREVEWLIGAGVPQDLGVIRFTALNDTDAQIPPQPLHASRPYPKREKLLQYASNVCIIRGRLRDERIDAAIDALIVLRTDVGIKTRLSDYRVRKP